MKWFAYGLDAPDVVRNLVLAGCLFSVPATLSLLGILPPVLAIPFGANAIRIGVPSLIWPGLTFIGTAVWMTWSSAVGKLAERERLLDRITWRGDEQVLDVGCGRGLMLVGAARRLTTGKARGIDVWRQVDLTNNAKDATLRNAEREGVADRVEVDTGDMRNLPYATAAFDVVLSKAAIHNIDEPAGRDQAMREIVRVLAPGGTLVIDDIRNLRRYEQIAREARLNVKVHMHPLALPMALVTFGSLKVGTLIAMRAKK
jgi:SAM-dependent methyltransferase